MTAPARTHGAAQVPQQYAKDAVSRIAQQYDREFSRLTSYAGTVVWNPANIAIGGSDSATVTVPGVRVGALAHVRVFAPYTLSGLQADGYVSADDTVTITLYNNTAGAVNLGSGTWGVVVENFVRTA
jgi:hypothetical protein